jgi:predicted O-methyltransferase YrrM
LDIIDPAIDRYLDDLARSSDPVLREMEELAEARTFPIVGPQVGRLLESLATMIGARRVLELGSGYGYSALHLARAVGPGGVVILTEHDESNARLASGFLERAGLADRADVRVGDGLAIAAALEPGGFDVVFNDADKAAYPAALDVARRLLRPGGLLVSDNMLWYGRVLEPDPADADTAGILELTRRLRAASDFVTTLIPMRDGVTVSTRLRPAEE